MSRAENCTSSVDSQVREIVALLSKAAKNYQVYLPNNRIFLTSLAEVKQALEQYLQENDVLTLVVKEFELLFDTTPVYSNDDKHQSLAFRMYRDGVRLISFHSGIKEEELVAFFEALTKCLECESLEEDFVTILWEKDLQSITYYEVNDYDTDFSKLQVDPTKGIDPEFHASGPATEDVHDVDVAKEIERLIPILELTSGDLEEVKNLAFVVEDDLFVKRVWQVICSTVEIDNTRETYLDLENALSGFLDVCVAMRQLGSAAEVLSELKTRFAAFASDDLAAALERIVKSRHNEVNMKTISDLLAGDREADHEQCLAYLSQLDPEALPAILELLPRCGHQSSRQALVMSMAAIATADPAQILKRLECDPEPEGEAALDALAAIGTEKALTCAMELGSHKSPKIRSKVASLAGRLKNATALDVTQVLLQDQNPSVRRMALGSLVEIGGEKCIQILTDLFTSKEFNVMPKDRKTSMLLALRKLPARDQTAATEAIFRMRGWRLRKSLEDTKAAMIDIIHLMDSDVVDYFEEELMGHVRGHLRRAAEAAVRKVRRDERLR